ncbi:D-alanyl-D-alanine carboxypeptidase [Caulobacter sp. 17J65-9]|uniref:D-alanyl-D-alanine carboxypeptidase n=1 Tax=Caulobacter sp. 17J65-9 TaxID=2709382 RepID=UPI0013C9EEC6|nr:D-alanyl-D-alanine carboxypeptidase [Caulobacter sp. 17J65-9]NEX91343.1 D-alanyl-D-alanine carboxypeptidase [Caulobacter sp. 17J65-9]
MLLTARRIAVALCLVFGAVTASLPLALAAPAVAAPADDVRYAAIVVDANSGEVLYARRADEQRYPASITKIMTLYLVFEQLSQGKLKLTDTITISPRAAAQPPSKLGLSPGQTLTVDEAIQALCIKSANDVALAVAEKIGGSEARFAALMTLRAQELGMTQSRFVNPHGLPDSRQLTSARDIAILSRAMMRDFPQYYSYFGQKSMTFRGQTMRNHNGLLHRMPGVDGIKTGFTNASGYNLAASAVRDGRRLITVVMGGSSTRSRDDNVADLLNTGFEVMRRRQAGEVINVAQNLFEHPTSPNGPVAYASMGPSAQPRDIGDVLSAAQASDSGVAVAATSRMRPIANPEESDPMAMVSGMDAKAKAKVVPAKTTPAKTAPVAKKKKKDPDAIWSVQVGAYKQKSLANNQLKQLSKKFAQHFADADGGVDAGGGWYRARFEGLTKSGAQQACKALKAKKIPCLVMAP